MSCEFCCILQCHLCFMSRSLFREESDPGFMYIVDGNFPDLGSSLGQRCSLRPESFACSFCAGNHLLPFLAPQVCVGAGGRVLCFKVWIT